MEIKKLINKMLHSTYACFTAMTVVYILVVIFLNVNSKEILIEGTRILLFLIFSFLVSVANVLFSVKSIHRVAAYLIHYVIYTFSVYACLLLPLSLAPASKYLVAITVFTIFYTVFMALRALFSSRYKKLNEEEKEYKKHFSK